ncbi:hypothetical protein [Streptomyces sp. NPDC050988]|uniref:hypothetical protein n=1 Tax=Streptomyces sp. NPDC050988 TaxID=3365637 RepID=UPI003797504F
MLRHPVVGSLHIRMQVMVSTALDARTVERRLVPGHRESGRARRSSVFVRARPGLFKVRTIARSLPGSGLAGRRKAERVHLGERVRHIRTRVGTRGELLSERDVRRLAPAVTAWLDRGAAPEAVRRTLTAGLPEVPLLHPAGFLAHRLAELLPPPLPTAPATRAAVRPLPLQNCDGCDRAFGAPAPGRCRDCRSDLSEAA